MTSRNKPGKSDGLSEHEQTMHQVWHGVIDTLRLLPTIPPSSTKPTTEDERQKDLRQTLNEKKHLDEALEKLNLLISLRNNNDGQLSSQGNPPVSVASTGATSVPIATVNGASGSAVPIPIVSISTPTPSLSSLPGGGVKRKRKNSISASPAPMMPPNSADSALTSIASPLPTSATLKSATRDITPGRGGTPGNRELTGKQKKELYHDQLPLQPGRRVAAKPPPKTTATGAGGGGRTGSSGDISMSESGVGSGGDEEWILATIKKCIQGDKMRYEVQDADDVNITWNTTLRSIIPLPDASAPTHLSSHPSNLEDFPKGSQVLALYPDTTSFYRATVMSAPIPGTGNGLGVKGGSGRPDPGAKKEKYRLAFVDDGDNIHDVHKSVVVMCPP